jgi:hypothetical protein
MKKHPRVWIALFLIASCGGGSTVPGDPGADLPDPGNVDPGSLDETPADPGNETRPDLPDDVADDAPLPDLPGDPGPDPALPFIAEGKAHLRDAESGLALGSFHKALDVSPDSTDALFGAALAEMVYGSELAVMSVSIAGQFADPEAGTRGVEEPSQNEYLAMEFHNIFMRLRLHFATAQGYLARIEGRPLYFPVEAVPVHLGIKPTLIYRGVFDEGDALLMHAVCQTVIGVFDFLAGQDMRTDVLTLVSLIKDGIGSKADGKLIFGAIAYLLNQDPAFLNVEPTEGTTLFFDSRDRFASAGPMLAAALERIEALGHGDDDVSWIEVQGANRMLFVRSGVRQDETGVPVEEVLSFELSPALMDAMDAASQSLQTEGKPVTLHGSVIPILAAFLSVAAKTGLLAGMGIDTPLGIDLGAFEIDGIAALLSSLLPNLMAFDWARFYQEPAGLRAWLPKTTPSLVFGEAGLVAEWECAADLNPDGFPQGSLGLLCAKEAVLADGPHFAGTSDAIAADGLASGFPVLAFKDPTWSGLLLLDPEGKPGSADASTFETADQRTLNLVLARMLGGLLSLVPSG